MIDAAGEIAIQREDYKLRVHDLTVRLAQDARRAGKRIDWLALDERARRQAEREIQYEINRGYR